jgi:hypothetical protein
MAGVALASLSQLPLNGLRHPAEAGTCGWYIWGGEVLREDADFFQPIHVVHLRDHCPEALPFLALPAGWRFLVAPGHVDVWKDETLLDLGDRASARSTHDLHGWAFDVTEVSAGVYRAVGTGPRNMRVESVGTDPKAALAECRSFALKHSV